MVMNKKILVTLLLTAMFGKGYADCNQCEPSKTLCPLDDCRGKVTSQTFFTVTPEFQAGLPERTTLWRQDRLNARKDGRYGTIQLVPFGGESTRTSDLAAYFSIDFKPVLNVNSDFTQECDIFAEQLNIYTQDLGTPPTTFQSQISFEPRRKVAGLGVSYRQGFARRDDGRGFFFEMSFPIEKVKTSMHLGETVIDNGDGPIQSAVLQPIGTPTPAEVTQSPVQSAVGLNGQPTAPVGSVCAAFQQPAWAYGRIENGGSHNSKSGVGDIDLLIGYDIINTDTCFLASHLGVLAPTGNRPNGILMFEPIVGYNKHTTLRMGNQFSIECWTHKTKERSLTFAFQSEFFFHLDNTQTRSFDVLYKPWSRYMQVYTSPEQALEAYLTGNKYLHTPGINVFTQDVKVNAGTSRTYQSAFIYNNEGFQGEFGYSFCTRPAECVDLQCAFPSGIAFKSLNTAGAINNAQFIGNSQFIGFTDGINNATFECLDVTPETLGTAYSPFDYYDDNTITSDDLDMNSAAHPAFETYVIYASMGNRWDDREYPLFIGGGGSYEFSKDNSAMTRWLLWAKAGFSF
jgi:hypothetical protein